MSLIKSEKQKADVLALIEKKHQEKRVVNITKTINDIKTSQFFKQNWDDLLYAAPNCLELLGTCQTVSTSDIASGLPLTKPLSGKFVYLQYDTLKGCLAQICNQGRTSFQDADSGMASISQNCADAWQAVSRIIEALKSMDAPISSIVGNMDDLKMFAGKARDTAAGIHSSFDVWQKTTMELWASCNNETAIVEQKQKQIDEKLAFSDTQAKSQAELVKDVKAKVDRMENMVKECKQDYKDALDSFPGAGTFLGQAVALSVTEGLNTAVAIGTSVMAQSGAMASNPAYAGNQLAGVVGKYGPANSQPTVVVVGNATGRTGAAPTNTLPPADPEAAQMAEKRKEGALSNLRQTFTKTSAFKKAKTSTAPAAISAKPGLDASAETTKKNGAQLDGETTKTANSETGPTDTKTGDKPVVDAALDSKPSKIPDTNGKAKSGAVQTQKPSTEAPEFDGKFYANDPALTAVTTIATYVDGIQSLIVEPSGARLMQWDRIVSPVSKPGEKTKLSEASTLKYSLERKQQGFVPDKKGLASQILLRTISDALAVVNEILDETKKASSLNEWVKPDENSEIVQSWDERITRCADAATQLKQAAGATPGTAAGGVSSIFPKKSDAEVAASTNLRNSMAEQTVKAATTKLTSTSEVYKSTLATYREMNEQNIKLQQDLAKAKAEVEALRVQEVTAENMKKVLVQCIGFLSQLKVKIGKLVEFFSSVSILVNSICDSQVKPFNREISNMIDENPGPENALKAFRYNAYLRDTIFQLTLQIYASFSLFRDVATMYREVHTKCIATGLEMVDKCGENAPKRLDKMDPGELAAWNKVLNEKKQALSKYCSTAQNDVHTIVKTKQDALIKGLNEKIADIDRQIGQFPAELRPTAEETRLLQNGRAIAANTAQEEALSQPSGTVLMTNPEILEEEDKEGALEMPDGAP